MDKLDLLLIFFMGINLSANECKPKLIISYIFLFLQHRQLVLDL